MGEAWRKVTTPSGSEAVEAVRVALVGTNRDLVRDMKGGDPRARPGGRSVENQEEAMASEREGRYV